MSKRGVVWYYNKELGKVVERGSVEDPRSIHYIQTDEIPPTVSHATDEGLVFTSRSKLYEHYRQNGFECTGGSHLTGRDFTKEKHHADIEDIRRDLEESYNKIKWGMAPISEKEKEVCLREERAYQEYVERQK